MCRESVNKDNFKAFEEANDKIIFITYELRYRY
jgi:hypothetical protein